MWEAHGTGYARVEGVEYPRLFSFRWALSAGEQPGEGNWTLVEFTLVPDGSGTRLRVVESGFGDLNVPDDEKIRHAKENTEGWAAELDELKRYLQRIAM
ncbi:MAG: SRPBCC domain-containing protein [Egibacteraceae bacterium]